MRTLTRYVGGVKSRDLNTLEKVFEFCNQITPNERGCKIWPFSRDLEDYGSKTFNGLESSVSRWVLIANLGRNLGPGLQALHTCDTPACVNSDHLYEGDQLQNIRDIITRGRRRESLGAHNGSVTCPDKRPRGDFHWTRNQPEKLARGTESASSKHPELRRGENNGRAKLTGEDVQDIRRLLNSDFRPTLTELGAIFGVSLSTIEGIKYGYTWKVPVCS